MTTAFERNCEIHPILNSASRRNSSPVSIVIAATSSPLVAARPVTSTAPPATAASDELGPVEICRDVQNTA